MKPITPEIRDGMPAAVAAAMLAGPLVRLTSSERKTCRRAREQVFVSASPIVTVTVSGEWPYKAYDERPPIEQEEKTRRRFARSSLAQLGKWLRRAVARRFVIQRQYLAVEGVTQLAERKRQAYADLADRLDIIRDACESEIASRKQVCDSVEVIRPLFRSVVYFRRKAL